MVDGWHDVHCVIEGPAVKHVWLNFRDRWNDTRAPHDDDDLPGGDVPAPITDPAPSPAPIVGPGTIPNAVPDCHVQVLRTLACGGTYTFLADGEQTARLGYEKAIDQAEHYVYIEDQYAWPCSLAGKLNAAAKRGVKVIFVLAHEYDDPKLKIVHNDLRHDDFLDDVRDGVPANSVFVFHLQQPSDGPDIYLHAKTMIVDDRYAAIGSTNVNRRNHTTDSELQVAVVGGTPVSATINGTPQMVRPFARSLRLRLWKEHLGLGATSSAVDDPVAGLSAWPTAANTQVHHACVHETPSFFLRTPIVTATAAGASAGALLSLGNAASTITGGLLAAGLAHFIATAVMNRKTDC
jgi:phosphatidylserine/phosphatidylglycerophosphate/cardiolipin synthase-like enzyme